MIDDVVMAVGIGVITLICGAAWGPWGPMRASGWFGAGLVLGDWPEG